METDLIPLVHKSELPAFAESPLSIEDGFDHLEAQNWMRRNWTLSVYIGVVYLLAIFRLKQWMEPRKPWDLSRALFWWNTGLAVFSIIGSVRMLPEMVRILQLDDGYHRSVCDYGTLHTPASNLWVWLFVLSKVLELGDTVFIVLRKRPLTFLHVYHHFSVLIFCWYTGARIIIPPTARHYTTMNYFVHSIMYTYFAIQSLRIVKIPRPISMSITVLQIVQMVLGIAFNVHAFNTKRRGEHCAMTDDALKAAAWIYSSYFLLFSWFFYTAYFRRTRRPSGSKDMKVKER